MKNILLIVGTRPNLIKASALMGAAKDIGIRMDMYDTGQHYDNNMQAKFYMELGLREPDEYLDPKDYDAAMVIGDTRSTEIGARLAMAFRLPLAHVEAGCRCGNRTVPEEIIRITVDALSTWLFCPTQAAADNVSGIFVGDILYDLWLKNKPEDRYPGKYNLVTIHRQENTEDKDVVTTVLDVSASERETIFPVHPRTRNLLNGWKPHKNVSMIDPVGYRKMLWLIAGAKQSLRILVGFRGKRSGPGFH